MKHQAICTECGLPLVDKCDSCPQCGASYADIVEKSHVTRAKVIAKKWGKEIVIANNGMYTGKILVYERGYYSSDHFHVKKHETFYVLRGFGVITLTERDGSKHEYQLSKGAVIEIPQGLMHKIRATSCLEIMEVSTVDTIEDSYRIEVSGKVE